MVLLLFSAVGPILLVLVRSAQTAHVVFTLCAELVFWCRVVILGVMITIACTCFLLLCDITIVPFRRKSRSESQNFEVSQKNKFRLSWKVS